MEPILKLPKTNELITRKQLILAAANKDGGAHVDHRRTDEYQRLEAGLNIKLVVGYRDGSKEPSACVMRIFPHCAKSGSKS